VFHGIFLIFILNVKKFRGILSVPLNIVMNMNNVMNLVYDFMCVVDQVRVCSVCKGDLEMRWE
jgi:hypothetical protein